MTSARLRGPLRSIAQATAIAVVLCFGLPALLSQFVPFLAASTAAATSERDFTEDDVNAAVKKVIDEINGHTRAERSEAGRQWVDHYHPHACRHMVDAGAGESRRHRSDPCLASD